MMSARRAATSMARRSTETVVILPVRGDQIRAAMLNACAEEKQRERCCEKPLRKDALSRGERSAQRVKCFDFFFFVLE